MKLYYSITLLLLSTSSFGQLGKFSPGVIYDQNGHKTSGLVGFAEKKNNSLQPAELQNATSDAVIFKKDSLSAPIRMSTDAIKGFKVMADSFTILRHFKMLGMESRVKVSKALSRVVVGDGHVVLYNCNFRDVVKNHRNADRARYNAPTYKSFDMNGYLVQKEGEEEFNSIELGIEEFVPQMSAFFKDSDEIVARIKKREYSYNSIEKLVRDYNAWYKSRR